MTRLARALHSISGALLRREGAPPAAAPASGGAQGTVHMGWIRFLRSLREAAELAHRDPESTGFMRYRAAQAGRAQESRLAGWVPLEEVSPYLVCAVVGAEDPHLFEHRGIDWRQVRRAIRSARRERRPVRAVSTITQQLARNLFLHPERSMKRKVQEAILARRMEQVLTKARILELYLNVVVWGEGIWGIGSAAREHFARTPAELDAFQALVLATMLPAPRRPLLDRNAQRALAAQRSGGVKLYGCGVVSSEELLELQGRIAELEAAIGEGTPAESVLRASSRRPLTLTVQDRPEISVACLLADGCGIRRHHQLVPMLMRAAREERSPDLPLWWTGAPAPTQPESAAA